MHCRASDLEKWLNQTLEDPIDPGLLICDPHHHLWDGPGDRGRYLPDDYLRDAGDGHHIVRTVFIECGTMYRQDGPQELRPAGETAFVREMVEGSEGRAGTDLAAGIVAFADLTLGSGGGSVLEEHIAQGGNRLRGIRQICTWDRDPSIPSMGLSEKMMRDRKFREGFSCLRSFDLSFDAWQYYTQLEELADLAKAFPDTIIIVNHTGGPLGLGRHTEKPEEVFREWKRGIKALAPCPNVFMKLGGLGMPRCGFGWHEQDRPPGSEELARAMAPFILSCIDAFGVERCMFESNFPVDKVSCSFRVLWNAFKRISERFTPQERAALFHDTAVRVYRLK